MTRTRILFPFVGGDTIGGSHVSALKLISALDPALYDPVIALHYEAGALGAHITELGLPHLVLPKLPILAPRHIRTPKDAALARYLFHSVPQMVQLLRRRDIDIVHTNDGRMHVSWSLPAKLSGCRFIWHHRQGPDATGVNKIAPLLADRILSVSEFSRPDHPIRSIDRLFSVVRSPFDLTNARPNNAQAHDALCDELKVPQDSLLLGYFGVLNQRKRPEHFVSALAAVAQSLPDRPVHGLIFGQEEHPDEGLSDKCKRRADALGVAPQLHMMGYRTPVEPALAGIDTLLITALNEPFGRTLIEAMHLGTPVVATNHGGNGEAICNGETGFLVDPSDPSSFVDPVCKLAQNPALRTKITQTAKKRLSGRFGLDKHVSQICHIYEGLWTDARAAS